jgi:hypothetical protein
MTMKKDFLKAYASPCIALISSADVILTSDLGEWDTNERRMLDSPRDEQTYDL